MKSSKDKSIFIKCECHGEGMGVDYDAEDGYYYFSYWKYGISNESLSWRDRLRYCWHVLTKGKAFNDEVVLTQESADKLIDFLLGYKRIPKEKMNLLIKSLNKAFKKKKDE
jgi:hypothetical protein